MIHKVLQFLNYLIFRFFGASISRLPHPILYRLGLIGGKLLFYLHKEFRKKAMTSLSIAFPDMAYDEKRRISKRSFQNLMITGLEFFWLKRNSKKISKIVTIVGGQEASTRLEKNQNIIFLSAHQANWEIPFLLAAERGKGIGIGRPIKNPWIYRYVLSLREIKGGKIIHPKNAIREGIRALKNGEFVGIVGDQAFPESSYSYPLFGTRAWTTTMPALLAYKTGAPIVVVHTRRMGRKYELSAAPPLFPNLENSPKEEVVRLMDLAMKKIEANILMQPEDWMWQHDRWKQSEVNHVKREYRFAFLLILLPQEIDGEALFTLLKKIYPKSFLTFFVPRGTSWNLGDSKILFYEKEEDFLINDHRIQLVLDFYGSKSARKHFLSLSAQQALLLKDKKEESIIEMLCKKDIKVSRPKTPEGF